MQMAVEELAKLDDRRAAALGLYKFRSLGLATEFVNRAMRCMFILHGDDGRFWVAEGRLASMLETGGLEIVS
jgi:hypothetical protein